MDRRIQAPSWLHPGIQAPLQWAHILSPLKQGTKNYNIAMLIEYYNIAKLQYYNNYHIATL